MRSLGEALALGVDAAVVVTPSATHFDYVGRLLGEDELESRTIAEPAISWSYLADRVPRPLV